VTAQNIDAVIPELKYLARRLFTQLGGSALPGHEKITMAGMPALLLGGTGAVNGTRYLSTLVFAFHGTTEYSINCQRTPAEATAVGHACVQVVNTFKLATEGQP
jgi:hypothetical protein